MSKTVLLSSIAIAALAAMLLVPSQLAATPTNPDARGLCAATCKNGSCGGRGDFCVCSCDASGNPQCRCEEAT